MEFLLAEEARAQEIGLGKGGSFSTTTLHRRRAAAVSSKNTCTPIAGPQNLGLEILPLLEEILPHVRDHTRVLLAPLHLLRADLLTAAVLRRAPLLNHADGVGRRFRRNRQSRAVVEEQIPMRLAAIALHGGENAEPDDAVRPLEIRRREAGVDAFSGVGEREEGEVYR